MTERREADARRRQAEKRSAAALVELERSNAELEQFAHVASHDLSEPLRVVGGFVGLLQKRYQGKLDDDADRFIDATVSGVERMQALIDALLAYSRVGSGDLQMEAVDTGRVAAEAVRVQERRIEEAGGEVVIGDLPTVSGDAVLLERVFQNLISNAIKFAGRRRGPAGDDRRRALGLRRSGISRSSDNGMGIPPEHAERDLRHVPAAPGAPDGGHRDRAVHHAAHNREARRPHLGRAGHRRGHDIQLHPAPGASMNPDTPKLVQILLVEDNPEEVLLTKETLKDAKVANEVHVAEDGERALRFARQEGDYASAPRPDLILLDLNLPRKDGREVLTELKADQDLRRIPVIVLTTSASDQDMLQAYDNAVNAYIRKPVSLDRFIEVVNSIDDFWLGVVALPGAAAWRPRAQRRGSRPPPRGRRPRPSGS